MAAEGRLGKGKGAVAMDAPETGGDRFGDGRVGISANQIGEEEEVAGEDFGPRNRLLWYQLSGSRWILAGLDHENGGFGRNRSINW